MCCLAVIFTGCDDMFATEDNPTPAYLSMSTSDVTLKVGEFKTRTAIAVSSAVIEYTSDNTAIATVDQQGTVKGVAVGETKITAKATGYSTSGKKIFETASVSYNVKVVPATVDVTSITLNKTSLLLSKNETETLTVTAVAPDDATDKTYTWSSDNALVATVDANGLVTAKASGSATISATANDGSGVKGSCVVTIGLLTGVFSVSSTTKVQFSSGNLQATYDGTKWTWDFAANQWDFIGNNAGNTSINGNGTISGTGTVDLFGWVSTTSTVLTDAPAKYGISNSKIPSDFGSDAADTPNNWGENLGAGWRVLTGDTGGEWDYLLKTRSASTINGTPNARYTLAEINTDGTPVYGMIIFPDEVTIANTDVTAWGAINSASAWATKCTIAQWAALAVKGCVFLPAAGSRNGTVIGWTGAGSERGYYWSATLSDDARYPLLLEFENTFLSTIINSYMRYYGMSVRLVRDVTTAP